MKYILMHRETVVAVLSVNDISGTVYRVDDVLQPAHLPIGLYAPDHKELAKNLNLWLAGGFAGSEEVTAVRQHFDDEVLCTKPVRSILAQSCRTATGMEQGQFL